MVFDSNKTLLGPKLMLGEDWDGKSDLTGW